MSLGYGGIYHPDPHRRRQNRLIRSAELDAMRAARRVQDLNDRIGRAENLQTRAAEVRRRRDDLLAELAATSIGPKDGWRRRLQEIPLTNPAAAAELESLKAEVDRYGRLMATFAALPAPGTRRPPMDADPLGFLSEAWADRRGGAREAAADGAVSLGFRAGAWADRRRAAADEAAAVASSLAGLIEAVRRHQSALRG